MNLPSTIPAELVSPLTHAIAHQDTHLLNLIELEVIRALGIQPDCAFESEKWEAIGIASIGRDLIISWKEKSECDCDECEGTGMLDAQGKTRTVSIDCPECDGSGMQMSQTDGNGEAFTDIDGVEVRLEIPEGIEFIDTHWPNDVLSAFLIEQKKAAA